MARMTNNRLRRKTVLCIGVIAGVIMLISLKTLFTHSHNLQVKDFPSISDDMNHDSSDVEFRYKNKMQKYFRKKKIDERGREMDHDVNPNPLKLRKKIGMIEDSKPDESKQRPSVKDDDSPRVKGADSSSEKEQSKKKASEDDEKVEQYRMNLRLNRQLESGIATKAGGTMITKMGARSKQIVDKSAKHKSWQSELGPRRNYHLTSQTLPKKFRPETGNGHLSAVVYSDRLHINNLLIGEGKHSRRARLPTMIVQNITRVRINDEDVKPLLRQYSMNMAEGVFTQTISGPGIIIEQRIYAHRNYTPLLVHEVDVRGIPMDGHVLKRMQVILDFATNGFSLARSDVSLVEEPYPDEPFSPLIHHTGSIDDIENTTYTHRKQPRNVHLIYTKLPEKLRITLDSSSEREKWTYILSAAMDEKLARDYFEIGVHLILADDLLYRTHLDTWRDIWNQGRVQVELSNENYNFPATVISSQYYIMSSLPWNPHKGYEFGGLNPCGLGHGDGDVDFKGHVYWDQDMWVFPSVMLLHPELAKSSMLQYRIVRLPDALRNAKLYGWKGAKFPWESGFTGMELAKDPANSRYQHHVTGAVSLAAINYILATNDTNFLEHEGGDALLLEVARFWRSRLTRRVFGMTEEKKARYRYEIWNAMGPDEYHECVNNSAYTNALAKTCMAGLVRINKFTERPITDEMKKMNAIAQNIYIPFDSSRRYHPEFDGYKRGSKIKQADTVLLGYPLNHIFHMSERRKDLLTYEKVLANGPGMSWGMHAIGWLELKDEESAWSAFKQQLMHVRRPFKVWSEYATGGRSNFITAAGGFLQSLLNGYIGFRLRTSGLYFDVILPPDTAKISIIGLNYFGNSIDMVLTDKELQLRCSGYDPLAPRLQAEVFHRSPMPKTIEANEWIYLPHGKGVIRAISSGKRWPDKKWSLRPDNSDKDLPQIIKSAIAMSNARQISLDAWRKREAERVKSRKKKQKLAKQEVPLEKIVAGNLRKRSEQKKVKEE